MSGIRECDGMTISNDRGSALIITLMLLLILTAVGIYAISISTTEMSIALQSKTGTATLNAADSGANFAISMVPDILVTDCTVILRDNSQYTVTSRMKDQLIKPGFGANYRFYDYEVDSTGRPPVQFVGLRTVEAVVDFGPVPTGTMY